MMRASRARASHLATPRLEQLRMHPPRLGMRALFLLPRLRRLHARLGELSRHALFVLAALRQLGLREGRGSRGLWGGGARAGGEGERGR